MRLRSPYSTVVLAACLALLLAATPVRAQRVPNDFELEALVKSTLATFNDANLSQNYGVMHAVSSAQVREQLTVEAIADAFQAFRDQQIDLAPVLTLRPTFTERPAVDSEGRLQLKGRFDTAGQRTRFAAVRYDSVAFDLAFVQSEGAWKMIRINVDVK